MNLIAAIARLSSFGRLDRIRGLGWWIMINASLPMRESKNRVKLAYVT